MPPQFVCVQAAKNEFTIEDLVVPAKVHDEIDPCKKDSDPSRSPSRQAAFRREQECQSGCYQDPDDDVVETEKVFPFLKDTKETQFKQCRA